MQAWCAKDDPFGSVALSKHLQQLQNARKPQVAGSQQQASARLGPTVTVLSCAWPRKWYIRLLSTCMKYTMGWVLKLL